VLTYTEDWDRLPRIHHNLYHMIGLDRGYYWSMERFFQRMEEVIDYYSSSTNVDDIENREWCMKLKPMSLAERTKAWMKEESSSPWLGGGRTVAELEMPMKEVAKLVTKETLYVRSTGYSKNDARFNAFVCEMEDDPMPAAHKRVMFQRLDKLLYDVSAADEEDCCPTEISDGICKF
jgi:hypothetical protein